MPGVTRRAFATLERTAPAVGARWAERLWFTVPAAGPGPGPKDGSAFRVGLRGHTVRGWAWGRGPVVYLVHGWGGHSGQLMPFVQPLVTAGFRVVAHDAPSHGVSDAGRFGSRSTDLVEFAKALDAVAARFGPAEAVVGHSMGGVAAVLAMRHGWLATERLGLIAPMVAAADAVPVFGRRLGFGPRVQRRLVRRIERRVGMPMAAFDLRPVAAEPGRPRLFAVHDRDDKETPHHATQALVAGWPDAELLTTTGLGHRRILGDPGVVRAVTAALVDGAPHGLPRTA